MNRKQSVKLDQPSFYDNPCSYCDTALQCPFHGGSLAWLGLAWLRGVYPWTSIQHLLLWKGGIITLLQNLEPGNTRKHVNINRPGVAWAVLQTPLLFIS